jgi:hypothetical protein
MINSKQDAIRIARLAKDYKRSVCHFVESSIAESSSIFSEREDSEEMNASPDDHDGPVTRVAEFLRSMPNRGPQVLNHALASRYNTNIEDSNMTLIEESKVPSIRTETDIRRQDQRESRQRDKKGNIKSLFHQKTLLLSRNVVID